MTAQEAKAMAFAKRPPVMPDEETMNRIRYYASMGHREVVIHHIVGDLYDRGEFSSDETNWLTENNYGVDVESVEVSRDTYYTKTTIRW